jgi:hypothetical protein
MNAASVLAGSIGTEVQQYYCLAGVFGSKLELSMQLLHMSCRLASALPISIGENGSIPLLTLTCTGILEHSMGARNRVGKGLSYRPPRLQRLASNSVPSPHRLL